MGLIQVQQESLGFSYCLWPVRWGPGWLPRARGELPRSEAAFLPLPSRVGQALARRQRTLLRIRLALESSKQQLGLVGAGRPPWGAQLLSPLVPKVCPGFPGLPKPHVASSWPRGQSASAPALPTHSQKEYLWEAVEG